jgi:putative transposase
MPGIAHHITQRGNNREDVFFSDRDRVRYLEILSEHCLRHQLRVLGWCLMTNHVHLIAVPGAEESMAKTLGQAHAQYSLEVNRAQHRVGHLWQNRFFSCALDSRHLLVAMMYVDLNPVRAGMVECALEWEWSSARGHAGAGADALLDREWREWMEEARVGWDFEAWRAALASGLSDDLTERVRRGTRLGEPCGDEEFVGGLEREAGRRLRVFGRGRPSRAAVAKEEQGALFG